MKVVAKLGIGLCFAAGLGFAIEDWSGKLIDADCYNRSSTSQTKPSEKIAVTCAPTASTANFAIQTSGGKVHMLDPSGNAKAATAVEKGYVKSDKDGDVHVTITGSRQGHAIKVEAIRGHKSDASVH